MPNIITSTQSEHLGKILENEEKYPKSKIFYIDKNRDNQRYFPDGEIYARLSKIADIKDFQERTIILHTGSPEPNDGLVELEMILENLRENKIENIEVFFAYFPFAMQDHIRDIGEINMAESIIKKLIHYYGVKKIYTIDVHFWGLPWVSKYPITNISAVPILKKIAEAEYANLVYLAPDFGSQRRTGTTGAQKTRDNSHTVAITSSTELQEKIKGNNIAVIDDLLETGGTLAKFYDYCIEYGAKKIIALITHGVLPEGIERIHDKYDKLYLTNTIAQNKANVCVCDLIYEVIN